MLCFRKLLVAIKIMDKRGRGGYQDFPSKVFFTTTPKNLAREPFCIVFLKTPVSKEIMHNRGGGYQIFPSKLFFVLKC